MSAVPSIPSALQHDLKADFSRTGPGTLGGRWMRQFWQPVMNSEDLLPGKAKPIRIMSEDFTLYRGHGDKNSGGQSGGAAHVVSYRCPHRATQLSTGWVEGDEIRCLYHGWKFDANGRCTERPQEPGRSGGSIGIRSYPTREHIGLIFVFFGEGEPPPFPPFPAWQDEGFIETRSTIYPCNFFQTHENNYDPCHILWSHSHGITHEQFASIDMSNQPSPEETEYGTVNRWTFGDGFRIGMIGYLPNAIRTLVPSPNGMLKKGLCQQYRDSYLVHVPIDDESHIFFRAQMMRLTGESAERYRGELRRMRADWLANWKSDAWYTDEILAGRMAISDLLDHPYLATLQDMVAQCGQGRHTDRGTERLGVSDRHMTFLRRIWARELGLLAAGQPTKRWASLPDCPALEEFRKPLIESGAL
jgi:5,5'-dehydrodivanillate O-demethylase oxygenase subunit